jgi:hypothetical protein
MSRNLNRYPYVQLVLVLSLVLLLVSFPVAQNRVVKISSSSLTHASLSGANKNTAQPDRSQPVVPTASTKQTARADSPDASAKAKESYGMLPLSFEANRGQTSRKVKFLARGQGYGLFLTARGAVLSLNQGSAEQAANSE